MGNPSSDSIVKILSSVGIEAEADKLEKVIAELSGKDLNTVIAEGQAKLAGMPSGGGAAPVAAAASSAAAAPAEAKKERRRRNLRKKMTTWDSVSSTNST